MHSLRASRLLFISAPSSLFAFIKKKKRREKEEERRIRSRGGREEGRGREERETKIGITTDLIMKHRSITVCSVMCM